MPWPVETQGLTKVFETGGLLRARESLAAVDGVSFSIAGGECFGLAGESGCGKSTLGRLLLGLESPTAGRVTVNGCTPGNPGPGKGCRPGMHMIYQDPTSCLDPRYSVRRILEEPLRLKGMGNGEIRERIEAGAARAGIGRELFGRFPHELSGGQRQRIGILRALLHEPSLIVADEPAASLDLSVQAQILNLLEADRKERHTTVLFISHNLPVMRFVARRMAVMHRGRFIETGETARIFEDPRHPYTRMLFASVLATDPGRRRKERAEAVPVPGSGLAERRGCLFYGRCPLRTPVCSQERPGLRAAAPDHHVACHHAGPLSEPY